MTLERKLKALANKRRLAILKYLERQDEASVGDIAEHIRLSFKATSRHLFVLTANELLDKQQKSREVYYYLADKQDPLVNLILSKV